MLSYTLELRRSITLGCIDCGWLRCRPGLPRELIYCVINRLTFRKNAWGDDGKALARKLINDSQHTERPAVLRLIPRLRVWYREIG